METNSPAAAAANVGGAPVAGAPCFVSDELVGRCPAFCIGFAIGIFEGLLERPEPAMVGAINRALEVLRGVDYEAHT